MAITRAQAQGLYESGHISADLFQKLIATDSNKEEDAVLKAAGKEGLKDSMSPKVEATGQSEVPVEQPATPEMENYRTWGVSPQGAPPAEPTQPEYKGPHLGFKVGGEDPNELSGFQRGITSTAGAPPVPENSGTGAVQLKQVDVQGTPVNPMDPNGDKRSPDPVPTPAEAKAIGSAPRNMYALGAQPPPEMESKPGELVRNKDGKLERGPDVQVPKSSPAFQLPGTQSLKEKNEEEYKAQEQAAADKKAEEGAAPPGSLPTDYASPASSGGGSSGPAAMPSKLPGLMNQLGQTYEDQKEGLKTGAKSDIQEANVLALHQQNQVYDLMERDREEKAKQADEAQRTQTMMTNLDNKFQVLSQVKIDPNRLYNNSSTGQKIVGALAGILGAFGGGAGRGAGVNGAVQVMEAAIDRDLKAQQIDIETGMNATKGQVGLLKDYMDVTKNRHVAYEAAKLDYMQRAKMQLDSISSNFKGPQALGKYQVAAAQLDERFVEQKIKLQQAIEAASAKGVGGGAPKGESEDLKFVSQERLKEKIPEAEAALEGAEKALKSGEIMGAVAKDALDAAGHIPIVGAIAKKAYGAAEPQAMRNEQYLQQVVQTIRHSFTGAGFSEKEAQGYADTILSDRSPAGIRNGLAIARKALEAKKAEINAGIGNRQNKAVDRGRSPREESELRHTEEERIKAARMKRNDGPGRAGAK